MPAKDEFDFDNLVVFSIPVKVNGETYTLKEASGDAAFKYRNQILKCTKLGPDGKPTSVENLADIEPLLISLCLFDKNNKPVSATTIRSWSARVCKKLYEKAREISELDDGEEDIASLELAAADATDKLEKARNKDKDLGNEPTGTETGSV